MKNLKKKLKTKKRLIKRVKKSIHRRQIGGSRFDFNECKPNRSIYTDNDGIKYMQGSVVKKKVIEGGKIYLFQKMLNML